MLGVPGHVTLLYPFKVPEELSSADRRRIAAIAVAEPAFAFRLERRASWPDTVYVALEPEAPFLRLHRRLAAAFPEYPVYGGAIGELVPHVTVAEGACLDDPTVIGAAAWSELPSACVASAIELIAEGENGRWQTARRFKLGDGPAMLGP